MICGQILYSGTTPAALCTQPWGVEHSHDDHPPVVRVYDPDREPDDVTVFTALRLLDRNLIYQQDDGTLWLRPGVVWEDALRQVRA